MNLVDYFVFKRSLIILLHLALDLKLLLGEKRTTREVYDASLLLIWVLYAILISYFSDRHRVTNVNIGSSYDQVVCAHHGHLDFVALLKLV